MNKLILPLFLMMFSMSFAQVKAHAKKAVVKPELVPQNFDGVEIYPGATKVPVTAKQAYIMDYRSGKWLLKKNSDQTMAPSSMTKMMTAYIVEEKILKGEISAQTKFKVSEKAWRTQGSKMFVQLGTEVEVENLLKGIIIQSGNDASIVVAENIMGTEEGFAIEMTRVAKELGMMNTNFKNASGLPEEGHYSTAEDMAKLGAALIRNHGKFYALNKELEFTYNGIKQGNRNPLLYDNIGCDGIKTGHSEVAGYAVTASCPNGEQRTVVVINGLPTMQARADEARRLVGWANANFMGKTWVKKDDVIVKDAKIKDGVKESIPLKAANDVYLVTLRSEQNNVKISHQVNALEAPIKAGTKAGTVIVSIGDNKTEVDLITTESVEKLGLIKRALKYIGLM